MEKPLAMQKISEEEFLRLKAVIESGEWLRLQVVSGSMEPLIKTGQFIVLKKTVSPQLFDIVVFRQNSVLICHFIKHINSALDRNGDRIYVTGSLAKLNSEDLPISFREILGEVVSHRLSRLTKIRILMKKIFGRAS